MPRYLSLWKVDSTRIPADPKERVKLFEMQSHAIDAALKSGGPIKEFGFFTADSGYTILETSSRAEAMGIAALFYPEVHNEPFEVIPWEEAKKAIGDAYSAQAQQQAVR